MKKNFKYLLLTSLIVFTGCTDVQQPNTSYENNSESSSVSTSDTSLSISNSEVDVSTLKEEINTFLSSINLDNYNQEEKEQLEELITKLNSILSSSNDINQLNAAFSAFKNQYYLLKTKEDYNDEIKELLNKEKEQFKQNIEIDNQYKYRVEELEKINKEKEEIYKKLDDATSIEEINSINLDNYNNLLSTSKTNAEYTINEMLDYGINSKWDLVNAHRDEMSVVNKNTIRTKNDGYALDSTEYNGDMEMVFSVNTESSCDIVGVLLANPTSVSNGDGIDGYLVNIKRGIGQEYYQVYYLENYYNSIGTPYAQYVGGWVYTDSYPNETVANNKTRVILKRGVIKLYKNEDYELYGDKAQCCSVDLTYGGTLKSYTSYHFGVVTWGNSGTPYDIELDMLAGSKAVDGKQKASAFIDKVSSNIKYEYLSSNKENEINGLIDEAKSYITNSDYSYKDILDKIEEIKEASSFKNGAIELMDNIFSDENSIKSSWDLVCTNVKNWTHTKGTNSVTTTNNSSSGWQLSKDKYGDIDMTMNVNGCQSFNPYHSWSSIAKAFLIGAESNGNYPKGYAVTFFYSSTESWLQVHYLDGTGVSSNFICGLSEWVNDLDIRITVINKELKIYTGGTQRTFINPSFANINSITLDNYNGGSIGILNWDDSNMYQSTFTLKEFAGKRLS